jgi:hypothetical protein
VWNTNWPKAVSNDKPYKTAVQACKKDWQIFLSYRFGPSAMTVFFTKLSSVVIPAKDMTGFLYGSGEQEARIYA